MRVLIIDDSRANRMVLQKFLKGFGFETLEAENGPDAIWMLNRGSDIDLITVDLHMPKMSGIQFVRLVREKPEFASIPILMISVETDSARQAEAVEAGVSDYLMKPFTREMIEEKLRGLGINLAGGDAPRPPAQDDF